MELDIYYWDCVAFGKYVKSLREPYFNMQYAFFMMVNLLGLELNAGCTWQKPGM
jgi:hypothetical protein